MARTNKIGIDYFPFDVDFFQDDKIQLIEAEFGVKGGYIAIRLLCKIYREGYFYPWGADECLLFAKNVGAEGVTKGCIDEVVRGLVKRGFFDESVFDWFGVLTSAGIQRRYFEATKRYKIVEAIREYLLVDMSEFDNVNINSINADINANNADTNRQKKGKEKKEKEKEKEKEKIPAPTMGLSIVETIDECANRLKAQGESFFFLARNALTGKRVIDSAEHLHTLIDQFSVELKARGDDLKNPRDFQSHLINWLKNPKNGTEAEKRESKIYYA